jgi:hypothetical protein
MPLKPLKTAPKLRLPRTDPTSSKEWQKRLYARYTAGESLHECQLRALREVGMLREGDAEAREERRCIQEEPVDY